MGTTNVPASARVLFAGILDYAGTFPPASLALPAALDAYARAAEREAAWILGRFVVSAGVLATWPADAAAPANGWPLSIAIGTTHDRRDVMTWIRTVAARSTARVLAVEFPPMPADAIGAATADVPGGVEAFFETPIDADLDGRVGAIARAGAMAKLRTGGVVAGAFPAAEDVVRALRVCAAADVACKATAGLHHAIRGSYALTYEAGSAAARMHGFLNLSVAAALTRAGDASGAVEVLEEASAKAFTFGEHGIGWRDRAITNADLAAARRSLLRSFGSCAVREPVEELAALGLL